MRIISEGRIREYCARHPDAQSALFGFVRIVRRAAWRDLQEARRTYPHADAVKVSSGSIATVFNVRGNRYRLIVAIHYNRQLVYVLRFLTHAEYDKNAWKEEL